MVVLGVEIIAAYLRLNLWYHTNTLLLLYICIQPYASALREFIKIECKRQPYISRVQGILENQSDAILIHWSQKKNCFIYSCGYSVPSILQRLEQEKVAVSKRDFYDLVKLISKALLNIFLGKKTRILTNEMKSSSKAYNNKHH